MEYPNYQSENNPMVNSSTGTPISKNRKIWIIASALIIVLIIFILAAIFFNKINKLGTKTNSGESISPTHVLIETSSGQTVTPVAGSSKYTKDTDNDSIPDFVEETTNYNASVDECLLNSCSIDETASKKSQVNVLFILDSSGSMVEKAGNEIKMTAAKNALNNLVSNMSTNVNIGLIVYGHKGSNSTADKQVSCSGIDLIYPLGKIDKAIFSEAVASFSPKGWTPIGTSLLKVKDVFKDLSGQQNIVFLITDGIETCDSDPLAAISELKSAGITPIIDVLGFAVGSKEAIDLAAIAQAGGGQYFQANDSDKFNEVFDDLKKSLEMIQCSQDSSQAYISCVAKRADTAVAYLNNLNQSLYFGGKKYQGVIAGVDDTHDGISSTTTRILLAKNQAGTVFSELLKKISLFFGEKMADK